MKSILQIFLFFLIFIKIVFPQWYQQSSGTTKDLCSLNFSDISTINVVGDSGTIFKTTNGGSDWVPQSSGTTERLTGVSFNDINNGTAVGRNGTIVNTTNGGAEWIQQISGTLNHLWAVSFIDAYNIIIVGELGTILRTTNGGTTWTSQQSGTISDLYKVYFSEVNIGTAVGENGTILKTTDGGLTWMQQISGTVENLWGVSFSDVTTGTAVGEWGTNLRTTNGGTTWTQQTITGFNFHLLSVSFTDFNNGTVVSVDGRIFRTTNGGIEWIEQIDLYDLVLFDVLFADANNGWVVGRNGTILRTTNGGGMPAPIPIWLNEIIVEDAGGTESTSILTIGQDPNATDSMDSYIGEYELPPPPPTGIFDARFNLPTSFPIGSLKDFRDSSETNIIWNISFQPSSAGYPMAFSWDSTSFPEGSFYLKDLIDGSFVFVSMKTQSSYTLTEPAITSLNISYRGLSKIVSVNNEWNMISVPLLSEDMSVSNLFPTAVSEAYGFDGGYIAEDTLMGGVGYWLKFGANEQIQIYGLTQGDTVSVQEGWNIIGPYEEDVLVSQLTTTPPGIVATNYFGFNDGYYIADTLKSGQGFWVRVTDDGVLKLNGGALSKDGEQEQFAEIDKNWGKIMITDNSGKSISLYAAEEKIESDLYELPPMPPTGIFDARYSSGKLVEDLSSEKTILINSDNYPITIKVEGLSLGVRDLINGKLLNEELKNGEEISITNSKITSIEVSGRITKGLPVSYELYQNYPNPFNPSTTIKFAIPKESEVNLSIYNVLGELVTTLVNGQLKAGYYEFEYNASEFSSGVYLYRIKANSFVETKKMIVIK